MELFGSVMVLTYLALQISTLIWMKDRWHDAGVLPLWALAAASLFSVVGGAVGLPLAAYFLPLSLPLGTAYLMALWGGFAFAALSPRYVAPSIAPPHIQTAKGTGSTASAMVKIVQPGE